MTEDTIIRYPKSAIPCTKAFDCEKSCDGCKEYEPMKIELCQKHNREYVYMCLDCIEETNKRWK